MSTESGPAATAAAAPSSSCCARWCSSVRDRHRALPNNENADTSDADAERADELDVQNGVRLRPSCCDRCYGLTPCGLVAKCWDYSTTKTPSTTCATMTAGLILTAFVFELAAAISRSISETSTRLIVLTMISFLILAVLVYFDCLGSLAPSIPLRVVIARTSDEAPETSLANAPLLTRGDNPVPATDDMPPVAIRLEGPTRATEPPGSLTRGRSSSSAVVASTAHRPTDDARLSGPQPPPPSSSPRTSFFLSPPPPPPVSRATGTPLATAPSSGLSRSSWPSLPARAPPARTSPTQSVSPTILTAS